MPRLMSSAYVAVLLMTVPACAPSEDASAAGTVDIIEPESLEQLLAEGDAVVLDVRGAASWSAAHIDGATVIDAASLRATIDGVDGQVTPLETTADVFGTAGLTSGDRVVVYGETNDTAAARVAWTLRYHGHAAQVSMLDGGFARWDDDGRDVSSDATTPAAAEYGAELVPELRTDAAWVLDHLDDPAVTLIDARTPDEFVAGHIPGAISRDWTTNLDADGGFRSEDELRALYGDVPIDETVVVYCQTGSRAAVDWLVLVRLGYQDVRLYDGSWTEWSALPDHPQES